jgi:hypothetical protein
VRLLHLSRRRAALVAAALGALVVAAVACGSEAPAPVQTTLCEPGENIFCRCPGGDAGTKQCNEAGDGFGECEYCESREDVGSGYGGFDPTGAGPGPGVGGGAPSSGTGVTGLDLLRPCLASSECTSGLCSNNYCTIECTRPSECPYPEAECVPWEGSAICMPACTTAGDCEIYGAPPSLCGYAPAIDNWSVTVCAAWGGAHELLPEGSDCPPLDHEACNLGYTRREVVCAPEGVCAVGCFKESDCPDGTSCSSTGDELGDCR